MRKLLLCLFILVLPSVTVAQNIPTYQEYLAALLSTQVPNKAELATPEAYQRFIASLQYKQITTPATQETEPTPDIVAPVKKTTVDREYVTRGPIGRDYIKDTDDTGYNPTPRHNITGMTIDSAITYQDTTVSVSQPGMLPIAYQKTDKISAELVAYIDFENLADNTPQTTKDPRNYHPLGNNVFSLTLVNDADEIERQLAIVIKGYPYEGNFTDDSHFSGDAYLYTMIDGKFQYSKLLEDVWDIDIQHYATCLAIGCKPVANHNFLAFTLPLDLLGDLSNIAYINFDFTNGFDSISGSVGVNGKSAPVPEPATLSLMALGLLSGIVSKRKLL